MYILATNTLRPHVSFYEDIKLSHYVKFTFILIVHFSLSFFQKTFTVLLTPKKNFFDELKTHSQYFVVEASVYTQSEVADPGSGKVDFQIPITVSGTLDLTK